MAHQLLNNKYTDISFLHFYHTNYIMQHVSVYKF